ncbi:hypothetical protein, partial [Roseovarius amoyensis]|uniref:hypothetical protein n=1 Tax=Roseovarius amoyensis TaxID=2211448 RepID=UPI0019551736
HIMARNCRVSARIIRNPALPAQQIRAIPKQNQPDKSCSGRTKDRRSDASVSPADRRRIYAEQLYWNGVDPAPSGM